MSKQNTELKSFCVAEHDAPCATAKWMFNPGDLVQQEPDEEDEEEDFCWKKQTTVSTVPVDSEDDSSIMNEDEFAEDMVGDIKELHHHAAVNKEVEPTVSSPSPQPPHDALLQNCHKEFMEMSRSSLIIERRSSAGTATTITTPVRLSNSAHHPRSCLGRLKKYKNQKLSLSDHNRDLIRSSMRNLLD